MRYPEFLKEQGTIGFVAPSFGCNIEPYKTAFVNAQKRFTEKGFSVQLGPSTKPTGCGTLKSVRASRCYLR